MYAKYVVEGVLPNTPETEDTIFHLLTTGLSGYLKPEKLPQNLNGRLRPAAAKGIPAIMNPPPAPLKTASAGVILTPIVNNHSLKSDPLLSSERGTPVLSNFCIPPPPCSAASHRGDALQAAGRQAGVGHVQSSGPHHRKGRRQIRVRLPVLGADRGGSGKNHTEHLRRPAPAPKPLLNGSHHAPPAPAGGNIPPSYGQKETAPGKQNPALHAFTRCRACPSRSAFPALCSSLHRN